VLQLLNIVARKQARAVTNATVPPIILVFDEDIDLLAGLEGKLVGLRGVIVIKCSSYNIIERSEYENIQPRTQSFFRRRGKVRVAKMRKWNIAS
jgi:hypothetical protein